MTCPSCGKEVLEIDVRCAHCGHALGATGAHRMLGTVVLGQYELVDVLGQGGMSVVFKGRHKMTNQEVALKILPPELAAHSQVKSRFLEEAKALAALDHPNIVHLYNFGQENGLFVLAMQYVQGRTWERMILENKRMDWQASAKVAIDVLRALEYAHSRGVVHRDMKPSNVLVRAHDGMGTVMDFGIAKMTTSTKLTATGQTMGTVRYMSPEQVRGHEVDLRTDIYSLGATLYESLTGDTPFDGETHFEIMTKHLSEPVTRPSARGVEVPKLVEDALMRSLMKKVDERWDNARDMRKVLEAALREGDVGIVETQKLPAGLLGDRPAAPISKARKPRLATATPVGDLADELEGATGAQIAPPSPPKSRMPIYAVVAVLVAASAVVAVLLVKTKPGAPQGYQPAAKIPGVRISAGVSSDGVTVETSGVLQPTEVLHAYQTSLAKLTELAGKEGLTINDPVQQIVTVAAPVFCQESAYPPRGMPPHCEQQTAAAMFSDDNHRRMFLLDDRRHLTRSMDLGLAEAICLFDPTGKLCKVTEPFRRNYSKPE